MRKTQSWRIVVVFLLLIMGGWSLWRSFPARAQMIDRTQNPNVANFGIAKSLTEEIGAGRGNLTTQIGRASCRERV